MSDILIGILLVTSSAKGSSLVYHWPPSPVSSPRLSRPRPIHDVTCAYGDNPWRAANAPDHPSVESKVCPNVLPPEKEHEYLWKRSYDIHHSAPSKGANNTSGVDGDAASHRDDEYNVILGYQAEFLAGILCPQRNMCHQRFGLNTDDLAFVGHPVCAESDGMWRFKPEKRNVLPRGRGSTKGEYPQPIEKSLTPERSEQNGKPAVDSSWLQTFHLVLVLDRPDPSSASSGVVWKYIDAIYEHIAFVVTAVLFQEQVLHNFVELECDILGTLKDDALKRGASFADFMNDALNKSSLAPAMKTLYEAIREGSIARITLNDLPLELQLPPHLSSMLRLENDYEVEYSTKNGDDVLNIWEDPSFARRLPALAPWKALLRLDDDDDGQFEVYMSAPHVTAEDGELAEQLVKFLNLASIFLSLADMASLLEWDLESQVYPIVRWLVHHRRAKLVNIVNHGLKTIFTVPEKLSASLSDLSAQFDRAFTTPSVPPLPKILSMVSTAMHQQNSNHFYAAVGCTKDFVPLYQDVVVWLLKRDLLTKLHLRIRVVATEELKDRVRMKFEMARAKKERIRARARTVGHDDQIGSIDIQNQGSGGKEGIAIETASESSPGVNWFSLSPKSARKQARQLSQSNGQPSIPSHASDDAEKWTADEYEDDFGSSGEEFGWDDWYRGEDNNPYSSMIHDPARATRLERLWLAAMSDSKEAHIARRFEKINQYFDGKCTDDEILFRAEISRKQLREVLHHYREYLQTFLHPS